MADKPELADENTESAAPAAPAPRRSPGHRGQDVRDTVAEMAARAQEISQEAGSKMAAAMKDVINAAAGLTAFAAESARDLVQYMVRRGQMTQEEADKLIRQAEEAASKRKPPEPRVEARVEARPAPRPAPAERPAAEKPAAEKPAAEKPAAEKVPAKAAAPKTPAKAPAKAAAKAPAKKAAPRSAAKAPAAKKKAPATKSKSPSRSTAKKKR